MWLWLKLNALIHIARICSSFIRTAMQCEIERAEHNESQGSPTKEDVSRIERADNKVVFNETTKAFPPEKTRKLRAIYRVDLRDFANLSSGCS